MGEEEEGGEKGEREARREERGKGRRRRYEEGMHTLPATG